MNRDTYWNALNKTTPSESRPLDEVYAEMIEQCGDGPESAPLREALTEALAKLKGKSA